MFMILLAFIHYVVTTATPPGAVIVSCFPPKSLSPSKNIGVTLSLPEWGYNISKNATTAVLRGGIEIIQRTIHDKERAALLLLKGPLNLTRVDADSGIPTFAVSTVLENLQPNTTYQLNARASDDPDYLQLIGWGPHSSVNCSTTSESPSVATSELDTTSSDMEPNGRPSSFTIGRPSSFTNNRPSSFTTPGLETPAGVPSRYLRVYRMTECQPTNYPDYLDNKVT